MPDPFRVRTVLVNVNNNNNNNDKIKSILSVIGIPAARIADPPIYQTVWFIALLIVIAVLFIVLLIFELCTRYGAAKYPGKFN